MILVSIGGIVHTLISYVERWCRTALIRKVRNNRVHLWQIVLHLILLRLKSPWSILVLLWRLQRASNLVGAFHIVFHLFLNSRKAFRLLLFGANDERMISCNSPRGICTILQFFIEVEDFHFVSQVDWMMLLFGMKTVRKSVQTIWISWVIHLIHH